MEKRMKDLKKYQIIMVTYQPFEEMVSFYKVHKIEDYPNIKMGRDSKFFLPPFFKIQSLPFQALYDKGGDLITTFEGNVKIDKLLDAFAKAK
jgi:primosomal protein N'